MTWTHPEIARLCWEVYANSPRITSVMSFQYRVIDGPSCNLVVFRGSDEIRDWIANVRADLESWPLAFRWGQVHAGFLDAWKQLRFGLKPHKPTIWAGHSLGGALAIMAARQFWPNTKAVVTFGAPKVGDAVFAREYDRTLDARTTRYVYQCDPVPLLPSGLLAWFLHRRRGQVTPFSPYRQVAGLKWFDGECWQESRSVLGMLKMILRDREEILEHHRMENYVKAMEGGEWRAAA